MNVRFHKHRENAAKILKNSCVRCHFMNFFFLELNINTHSFDLASWPKRSSKVSWSQLSDFSRTFSITEREMCTKKLTLISWKAYRLIYYSDLRPRWLDISLTSEKNSDTMRHSLRTGTTQIAQTIVFKVASKVLASWQELLTAFPSLIFPNRFLARKTNQLSRTGISCKATQQKGLYQ